MHLQKNRVLSSGLTAITLAAALTVALPVSANESRDHTIFALEHALVGVGYKLNKIDGIMDPVTEQALLDYQEKNPKLTPTGKPDDQTLMALGIHVDGKAPSSQAVTLKTSASAAAPAPEASQDTQTKEAAQEAPATEQEDSRSWFFF